jgi:CubicO group peptidase (beta-lactamase class C family)
MSYRYGLRAPSKSWVWSFSLPLILILSFNGMGQVRPPNAGAASPRNHSPAAIDAYIAELSKRLPVTPGLSVAVVRGDKTIYARGFGYRDLKAKLPVTPQTQFYIASTTKAFTATAAKLLADEGKFDLDAPLKKYLPNLVLKAPLAAEQITIRDLLTHRSGISNEAINFRTAYTGQYDAGVLLELLAGYSKPVSPEFRYSNIGYLVAALAMEKATGQTWQQIVERLIFQPLGMKSTTAYASKAKASADFALPYLAAANGAFDELPYKEDSTMHAAGGISSSAEDLAKWLVMNMNGGKYGGRQIIAATSLEEVLAPQINQKRDFYRFKRYGYSLGWNIGTYNGDKFIHCFGEFPGFRPHVSFMPEHNIGVVVLVNESTEAFSLPDLIACDIYDHLLGRRKTLSASANPEIDKYVTNLQKGRDERAKKAAAAASAAGNAAAKRTDPTLALNAYAGEYENPEWGRITIAADAGSLSLRFGVINSTLVHSTGDTFEAKLRPGETSRVTFKVDPATGAAALSVVGQNFARVRAGS